MKITLFLHSIILYLSNLHIIQILPLHKLLCMYISKFNNCNRGHVKVIHSIRIIIINVTI